KKISGTLVSFGGHVDTATWGTTTAYVDGIRKGNYSSPDSVFVADDENIHKVIVYIKTASTINETHKIYIQPNRGFAIPVSVEIYDWKLEKGNRATDWSPAPEDQVNKTNILSSINLSTEGIKIQAPKIDIQGIVSFINSDGSTGTMIDGSRLITGSI